MSEMEEYYPPKPILERKNEKRHFSITLLSILIFAFTFSLIIDDYLFIFLLLAVLLLHELGHFTLMKIFKYENLNLLFIPFIGAFVSGQKKRYSQKEIALMILAGPVPGIIIGAFLLLFGFTENNFIILEIATLLVFINVLNLIPIEPLDGGKLIQCLFVKNQVIYGLIQVIITVCISLSIAIIGLVINSWILIILGLFMGFRVKQGHKMYLIRKEMQENKISFHTNYEDLLDSTYAKIKRVVMDYTPSLEKMKEFEGTDEYNQLLAGQVDSVLSPPVSEDTSLVFKIFMLLLWLGSIGLSIFALLSINFNTLLHAFQIG